MSEWKAKRFWTEARAEAEGDGYTVRLDGRPVKTPAKAPLTLPTRAMAEAVAAEWDAQEEHIRPDRMPVTRAANAAIDKVAVQHREVVALIADYGATDLLCYRAEHPEALIARQAEAWDPLLNWAAKDLGAKLVVTRGVVPVPQPEASLRRLHEAVRALDPFRLTAMHDLVSLSGSLVIGLAAARGVAPAETLWQVSQTDETWQQELWGIDEEAAATTARKKAAFEQALAFYRLCGA